MHFDELANANNCNSKGIKAANVLWHLYTVPEVRLLTHNACLSAGAFVACFVA